MTRLVVDAASAVPSTAQLSLHVRAAEVVLEVELDREELRRRRRSGVGQILSLDLLNVLARMPVASVQDVQHPSDYLWRLLRTGERQAALALEAIEGPGAARVVRRAVEPLSVRHARVRAGSWRTGLTVASRFAPYCSRELVLGQLPTDEVGLELEAAYLGVGISIGTSDPAEPVKRIIEPAPFVVARHTGARWLFAERLGARYLQGGSSRV